MIRLRQSLDAGLRHPLLGPLLLLTLALLLSFLLVHSAEHDLEQLLFACAVLGALALRVAAAPRRFRGEAPGPRVAAARWRAGPGVTSSQPPPAAYAFPLRR